MEILNISTQSKDYPVYIGNEILNTLESFLSSYSKILIITDKNLESTHLDDLKKHLPKTDTYFYIAPNGEYAKTFQVYEDCITFGLEKGLDRKSVVLAFGGGAIGDLAGFVAATYMRGIPFIQIPTTILAHDSAIGGKVAINHALGKNMVGAFYQPELVIYDTKFLSSLPIHEKRSGFSEVVKHSLIADLSFLNQLMDQIYTLDTIDNSNYQWFLKKGMQIKANIVSKDEKELNIRAFLNFGHTLGHALEASMGYGKLTHGEAVMIGMVYAINLSKNIFQLDFPYNRFIQWIDSLGYHWRIPSKISFDTIYEWMIRDKKSNSNTPVFVLLQEIGKPVLQKVNLSLLESTYYLLQEKSDL